MTFARDDVGLSLDFDNYRSKISEIDISICQFNKSELPTLNQQNEMRVLGQLQWLASEVLPEISFFVPLFWGASKTQKLKI